MVAQTLQCLTLPNLTSTLDRHRLSPVLKYIATSRPEKFLGFLKTNWSHYSVQIKSSTAIKDEISNIKVSCIHGLELLNTTVSTALAPCSKQYLVDEELPFLNLSPKWTDQEWSFLELFGVLVKDDLKFCLRILGCICDAVEEGSEFKNPKRMYKLYETIQLKYMQAGKMPDDKTAIL